MSVRTLPSALAPLPTTPIEIAKRAAARAAVDEFVKDGMDIGVGSGSTIVYAIQRLAELAWGDAPFKLRCVPTSFQSRQVRDCFFACCDAPLNPYARAPRSSPLPTPFVYLFSPRLARSFAAPRASA